MSLWTQAKRAADLTPANRNRTADFFRAAAIMVVVFGHWLVSVPYLVDGELKFTELLVQQPWTQFVTWALQVMPIFFFVGGYSNAASWSSALTDPEKRRIWQATRLRRLILPITPLVLLWGVVAGLAGLLDTDPDMIRGITRAALIPVWFLAVYVVVSLAVPVSYAIWQRIGLWSVAALVAGAVVIDFAGFALGMGWARWANYAFVWLAVHQLGYWWWRDNAATRAIPAAMVALGIGSLLLLVGLLGYPVAMISVPGEVVSNSRPPTVAMLAIGCFQIGLILLVSDRVARWLGNSRRWAVVILLSQRIMTIYLWHLTALLALVGLALLAGGTGLHWIPGSGIWWLTRIVWIAALLVALAPLVMIFGRLEEGSKAADGAMPGPLRATLGALLACGGLTFMALDGTYSDNALGVNVVPIALVLAGVALAALRTRGT